MKKPVHRHSVLLGLLVSAAAHAGSDYATFTVQATVNDTCEVQANNLDFGNYNPNAPDDVQAKSTITATCTPGTEYEISLDSGQYSGEAQSTSRSMNSGSYFLDYELYQDPGRNTLWNSSNTLGPKSASAGDNQETVYGRIPSGQFVGAGNYDDTINVTISF